MKKRYKRVIVKFGTNLLTRGTTELDLEYLDTLTAQVAKLRQDGVEVIVVSSGAVAAGRAKLGVARLRRDIPFRQVLAAVGQGQLMQAYDALFAKHGIVVAQTLLTRRDLSDRLSYLNARNTLLALLHYGVVPIVNENDAVAVEELAESRIGENDTLAALTANLVDADLLLLMMTTEGLFTADPGSDPTATLIERVERIDSTIESYASGPAAGGRGGMVSKLSAARLATAGGTDVVLASGLEPEAIARLVHGEALGTIFPGCRQPPREPQALDYQRHVDPRRRRGGRGRNEGAAGAQHVAYCPPVYARCVAPSSVARRSRSSRLTPGASPAASPTTARKRCSRSAAPSRRQIAGILGYDYGAEAVHRDNLVLV